LVHAVQQPLGQRQAQCQQQGQRHQADGPQTAQVQQLAAQLPGSAGCALGIDQRADGGRDCQPSQGQGQQGQGEGAAGSHRGVPFRACTGSGCYFFNSNLCLLGKGLRSLLPLARGAGSAGGTGSTVLAAILDGAGGGVEIDLDAS